MLNQKWIKYILWLAFSSIFSSLDLYAETSAPSFRIDQATRFLMDSPRWKELDLLLEIAKIEKRQTLTDLLPTLEVGRRFDDSLGRSDIPPRVYNYLQVEQNISGLFRHAQDLGIASTEFKMTKMKIEQQKARLISEFLTLVSLLSGLETNLKVYEDKLAFLNDDISKSKEALQRGQLSEFDVRKQQRLYQKQLLILKKERIDLEEKKAELEKLLGQDAAQVPSLPIPEILQQLDPADWNYKKSIPYQLAFMQTKISGQTKKRGLSNFLPEVGMQVDLSKTGEAETQKNLSVFLKWRLFSRGQNISQHLINRKKEQIASLQFEQENLAAEYKVRQLEQTYQYLTDSLQLYQKQIQSITQDLQQKSLAYREGKYSLLDLNRDYEDLFISQAEMIALQKEAASFLGRVIELFGI